MSETQQQGVRVALAEDDANLRKTYVAMLNYLGHSVVCAATNGAELVEQCRGKQVDVVLLDLEMPVLDGLAAAEEVTSQGIPVVIVSGHPDATEIVVEKEPIATRVLKPATITDLHSAIQTALRIGGERKAKPR